MPYATADDVAQLNPFPTIAESSETEPHVDTKVVESWLQRRSSELDLLLRLKGLDVPVSEPAELMDVLKMAVTYGAAAMLANAPKVQLNNGATQNIYLQEFIRLKDWLASLSPEDLVDSGLVEEAVPSVLTPPGLSRASNKNLCARTDAGDASRWYDHYPVRRVGERL